MVPKTGRPPSDNPRTHVIPVRLSATELAEVKAAAEEIETRPGELIRDSALAAARKINRRAAKGSC